METTPPPEFAFQMESSLVEYMNDYPCDDDVNAYMTVEEKQFEFRREQESRTQDKA